MPNFARDELKSMLKIIDEQLKDSHTNVAQRVQLIKERGKCVKDLSDMQKRRKPTVRRPKTGGKTPNPKLEAFLNEGE